MNRFPKCSLVSVLFGFLHFVWRLYLLQFLPNHLFQPLAEIIFDSLVACHLYSHFKSLEEWSPDKSYLEITEFCVFVLIIHSKTYARFLLVNVPDRRRLLLFVHRIVSRYSRLHDC